MPDLYSVSEAATLLGVTPKTLRNWDKEGSFKPESHAGDHRRYSASQIEQKAGKTIAELSDPVLSLSSEDMENLLCLVEGENKLTIDFNKCLGDSIKERYEYLYLKLVELNYKLYRKNGISPPNFLLCSPEIGSIFETATAGFAPSCWGNDFTNSKGAVLFRGVINCRWRLYITTFLEANQILLGYRDRLLGSKDESIYQEEDFLGVMQIDNFLG